MYWTCKLFGDTRDNDIVLCMRTTRQLDRSSSILSPARSRNRPPAVSGDGPRCKIHLREGESPSASILSRTSNSAGGARRFAKWTAPLTFSCRDRERGKEECTDYFSTSWIRNGGIYYLGRNERTWLMPLTLLPDALRRGTEYGASMKWSARSLSVESESEWTWRDATSCRWRMQYMDMKERFC